MTMNTENNYQICNRCVMDTSVPDIVFDKDGTCNYCTDFINGSSSFFSKTDAQRNKEINELLDKIKARGKGNPYDCIIGVSGGVDSSWVLVKVVEFGLRPLAVHMDNGWNSELAQNNIAGIVKTLGVDLYTHVIDWEEYRALMQAFFDSDVIDIELLYDNAMLAVNYQQAHAHSIKYILAGTNQATEGMEIPPTWNWFKFDKKNIKAIAEKFGQTKLNSFPSIGTMDVIYYENFRRTKWISFLDYIHYQKSEALDILEKNFSYKRYPYKHYESIFTRFYQGYILPAKFRVDKRRVHLSTLIISGQLKRSEALIDLEKSPYPDAESLENDIQYFLKKMQWTQEELSSYLRRPPIKHSEYSSEKALWEQMMSKKQFIKDTLKNIKVWS